MQMDNQLALFQLTFRESLRHLEACLRSMGSKLNHVGFPGRIARSTLADANETRDSRIFADFAQMLIGLGRPVYEDDPIGLGLDQGIYVLDSTAIDLRQRRHRQAGEVPDLQLHGSGTNHRANLTSSASEHRVGGEPRASFPPRPLLDHRKFDSGAGGRHGSMCSHTNTVNISPHLFRRKYSLGPASRMVSEKWIRLWRVHVVA